MAVNPAGFQQLGGGADPRIITGKALAALSGGQFVNTSGVEDVVSSGVNSYGAAEILFDTVASGITVNGILLQNAGSNDFVAVLRTGDIIVRAAGTISGGQPVHANGADAVVGAVGSQAHGWAGVCGRAITGATSGVYLLVGFNF